MKAKVKIIFDTDIGSDCDDAGALALLHRLCDLGEAELLAVTACHSNENVAGCIDAINTYYGRKVPVGINYDRQQYAGGSVYDKALCQELPNDYPASSLKGEGKPEDSLHLLRRMLAAAEDKSITLVATGPFSSLARLVESKGDEFSPLNGRDLIEEKVLRTVVMGGRFYGTWPMPITLSDGFVVTWEWNIKGDKLAAQKVCELWPGELVFASYELGQYTITMKEYARTAPREDPVRRAYELHPQGRYGRESWDHTAMLYAVRPDAGYYYLHPWGRIRVDDEAVTHWQKDEKGKHTYLIPRVEYDEVRSTIDQLVLPQKEDAK